MTKLFPIKKLSTQIAFIVTAAVILIGGAAVVFMQTRVVNEMDIRARLFLRHKLRDAADAGNAVFTESSGLVSGMRNIAEANFDTERFITEREVYFDGVIRPALDEYFINVIRGNEFISAAYFALDPDLSGVPLVLKVYFEENDGVIEATEPQTYEEYMDVQSEDILWFYGAFLSGQPYWTAIYLWGTGDDATIYVSYIEPVIVNGKIVGVVGIDISIYRIETLIREMVIYDTGFAVLMDKNGNVIEVGELIGGLSADERARLEQLASANNDDAFDITLGGTDFIAAQTTLSNGFSMYAFAPRAEVMAEINAALVMFIIVFVIAIVLVVLISHFIGKQIGKPVAALSDYMRAAGTTGDISYTRGQESMFDGFIKKGGEIGQLIKNCKIFMNHIIGASESLEAVASGDLTVEVNCLSDKDIMGVSLNKMVDNLNHMFSEIHNSSVQVSDNSKVIADGAAALSYGASQQSEAIDSLSQSIDVLRSQTNSNAQVAARAAEMSREIRENAEKGSTQMDNMIKAVTEINDASNQISKVIKVIDDIAFQTNILALNAAVEAARAGQHGKGFAVVAEEVRSLAAKSAKSAKDTGVLIESTVTKANLGMSIASETSHSLTDIVDGINRNAEIIDEIANESSKQIEAIDKLNAGIGQVAQVVNQNNVTAQEEAAASAQMSGQSAKLESLLNQFNLNILQISP